MDPSTPPKLIIPPSPYSGVPTPVAAQTPGANSTAATTTQTGRPPLWTNSNQRKMVRLYVYSTLGISKILEVIHHPTPVEFIPG